MWNFPIAFLSLFTPRPTEILLSKTPNPLPTTTSINMAAATTSAVAKRMIGKLSPKSTAMLLCDVQDRFRPIIHNSETVISNSRLLTSACDILDIPVVITEQYPKAFGPTVTECFQDGNFGKNKVFPKTLFSMMTPEVSEHIQSLNATSFIISGIETHVCVQQTVLDLLEVSFFYVNKC